MSIHSGRVRLRHCGSWYATFTTSYSDPPLVYRESVASQWCSTIICMVRSCLPSGAYLFISFISARLNFSFHLFRIKAGGGYIISSLLWSSPMTSLQLLSRKKYIKDRDRFSDIGVNWFLSYISLLNSWCSYSDCQGPRSFSSSRHWAGTISRASKANHAWSGSRQCWT